MTKKQIEKTYGVKVVENGYYSYFGNYVKLYDIYSADGCKWDSGFKTIKAVEAECKEWSMQLRSIKNSVARGWI